MTVKFLEPAIGRWLQQPSPPEGHKLQSELRRFVARLANQTNLEPEDGGSDMTGLQIIEKDRHPSPAVTPQALAWDVKKKVLWMGSRDLHRIYAIDPKNWKVLEEREAPGIPWAAVAIDGEVRFTIGEGADDDRYVYRYTAEAGFSKMFACPEFTGSYLSFDGKNLYLSQWYKHRILKFDEEANVIREIDVGGEICGHAFVDRWIYVLRGQEQPNEDWRIARLDPKEKTPQAEDIALVPFACRSLTFDGELFWSNYRAQDTIVSFALPN